MPERHLVFSVLLFQADQDTWVVQALERDISASGPSIESAKLAFERTVAGYIELAKRHQIEPLSNLRVAPPLFWTIWNGLAQPTIETERMLSIPAFMIPLVTYDPLPA